MKPFLITIALALASCTHETAPPRAIPAPIQSAAVTGGLIAGDEYRTSAGAVMIVTP